ncbi:MAG: lysoplasmalogenase [Firmicutes bacterium]|nr:lysoplasmalogenase [Bacillota bacterium]
MIKFILIPICLVVAYLFLMQEKKENYVTAVCLKGLASLCFVLLGILSSPGTPIARLIVIGLILGLIADVLLNLRYVFKEKGQLVFLVGILVFLSGHILYLAAVLPISGKWLICLIAAVILTALLMWWILSKITAKMAFKIFGIVYIGAIVFLNCAAICNLIVKSSAFTWLFAAGAVLFLISDVVLILNTFGGKSRFTLRVTNIGLYYIGQMLIALSLIFL